MPRRERRRRGRGAGLLGLLAVALIASIGANGARAQTPPSSPAAQFGGFLLNASGEGLSITYDSPGLIPGTPSPLFAVNLPEAVSTMSNGPSGYALASLAYPGALIADLGTVLATGGFANPLPGYPIRTQAFYPAGPTLDEKNAAGSVMRSSTTESASDATAAMSANEFPGMFEVDGIIVDTHDALEEGRVVSRVRSAITGIDLFYGLIHIDSVVTDLVSVSDGVNAATDGRTVASGVTVLGLQAAIDGEGIHLVAQDPADREPTMLDPITGPLLEQGGLGELAEGLQPVAQGLGQLITSVVGGAGDLNDLFAASGISIRVLEPVETIAANQASRLANGLQITMNYDGETTPVFADLLRLIPPESLPSDGIPGFPLPSSPQALVQLLRETHIIAVGIAPGAVAAQATPPFSFVPTVPGLTTPLGSTGGSGLTTGSTAPRFATPTPTLTTSQPGAVASGSSLGEALPIAGSETYAAALALLLALGVACLAWGGSRRLADTVLAATASSCPEGLDRPTTHPEAAP